MDRNLDSISYAVTLIIKAAIMAAQYSGIIRTPSLRRLATMDVDAKDRQILFL